MLLQTDHHSQSVLQHCVTYFVECFTGFTGMTLVSIEGCSTVFGTYELDHSFKVYIYKGVMKLVVLVFCFIPIVLCIGIVCLIHDCTLMGVVSCSVQWCSVLYL